MLFVEKVIYKERPTISGKKETLYRGIRLRSNNESMPFPSQDFFVFEIPIWKNVDFEDHHKILKIHEYINIHSESFIHHEQQKLVHQQKQSSMVTSSNTVLSSSKKNNYPITFLVSDTFLFSLPQAPKTLKGKKKFILPSEQQINKCCDNLYFI